MSIYRPYWQRHPWQRRILAVVLLVFFPVVWPVTKAIEAKDELAGDLRDLLDSIKD